jgi:hypothetical protein
VIGPNPDLTGSKESSFHETELEMPPIYLKKIKNYVSILTALKAFLKISFLPKSELTKKRMSIQHFTFEHKKCLLNTHSLKHHFSFPDLNE